MHFDTLHLETHYWQVSKTNMEKNLFPANEECIAFGQVDKFKEIVFRSYA